METKWEQLSDQIWLQTSKAYGVTTDAFLLARFASPKPGDAIADLGTGCGVIPLLLSRDFSPRKIVAVDIQMNAISQFEQSIIRSGLMDRVHAVCGDFRLPVPELATGDFDLVTCNPPYFEDKTGKIAKEQSAACARSEICCTLKEVCISAARLLRHGGRVCFCFRPERLCDLFYAMRLAGLEPKRLCMVHNEVSQSPWLVLVEGRKGGRPSLQIEPPFALTKDGRPTAASDALYRTLKGE